MAQRYTSPPEAPCQLLDYENWGEDALLINELKESEYYPLLVEAFQTLNYKALYPSPIHGYRHIHRVLFLAALLAMKENLTEYLARQLFRVASYHDVGRKNDGLDPTHGARSAMQIEKLTGQTGIPLLELKIAATSHSMDDGEMQNIADAYFATAPSRESYHRAIELCCLLKDADNLDRVRVMDLDEMYLRHQSAKDLAPFAYRLYNKYPDLS